MKSLKDTKIKTSLLMGYGVTIGLATIFLLTSLFLMMRLSKGYDNIIEKTVAANNTITMIRLDANIAARNVRDIALIPEDPNNETLEARANEVLGEMDQLMLRLKELYPLKDGALDNYETLIKDWKSVLPKIITAIKQGKQEEAKRLVQYECTPKLDKMASAAAAIDSNLTDAQNKAVAVQQKTVTITIIAFFAVMIIATVVVLKMAFTVIHNVTDPTYEVHKALVGFSEGKFDIKVDYQGTNELGEMCDAMRKSQYILSNVVEDESQLLGKMAEGNFNVNSKDKSIYVGGLASVYTSIQSIKEKLSDVLSQINSSADQVSAGADQVSAGAQGLSQGATEQASSVEELAATITDISNQINRNAENAQQATQMAKKVGNEIMHSNEQMEMMTVAMGEINEKSTEIAKIIKTIEDIAFQTNILALNAAVEAARAGVAGKGFAVVADEVRNLASKSAEASKNTSALIESSVIAVENGTKIATETAQSLLGVVEGAKNMEITIGEIAEASQQQAAAVEQVTLGVDQISSVVQTNSATAEESAAASEELSAQANVLNDLVSQFVLLDDDATAKSPRVKTFHEEPSVYDFGTDKY